jgi:hypothetical protein
MQEGSRGPITAAETPLGEAGMVFTTEALTSQIFRDTIS